MVRYKREVLFGWVDLLVSFGGIAGLFLGFSLLSGVEILYYFTMRTCCMVLKEKQELKKITRQKRPDLPPKYDSLMEPYSKILLSSETGMNFRRGMGPESWKNADVFLGNQPQLKSSLDVKPPFGIEFIN